MPERQHFNEQPQKTAVPIIETTISHFQFPICSCGYTPVMRLLSLTIEPYQGNSGTQLMTIITNSYDTIAIPQLQAGQRSFQLSSIYLACPVGLRC